MKIEKIIGITTLQETKKKNIDLVMGWSGFDSLEKYGFICRIRENNTQIYLQCKKRINETEWEETKISLNSFNEDINFKLNRDETIFVFNREREERNMVV